MLGSRSLEDCFLRLEVFRPGRASDLVTAASVALDQKEAVKSLFLRYYRFRTW